MNTVAKIGHNNPPDPIDAAIAPYDDLRAEAENWLDGQAIETEAQADEVDAHIKNMKAAKRDVEAARKDVTDPLRAVWQAELDRWKPTLADLDRIVKGLVDLVDPFKRKQAAEKAERARKLQEEAAAKLAASQAAHTDTTDIAAARERDALAEEAMKAQRIANAAAKDTVKGMRTYKVVTVTDHVALGKHIWAHDRASYEAFLADWAEKHATAATPGATVTEERRAV